MNCADLHFLSAIMVLGGTVLYITWQIYFVKLGMKNVSLPGHL
jgi:hypothetical protein